MPKTWADRGKSTLVKAFGSGNLNIHTLIHRFCARRIREASTAIIGIAGHDAASARGSQRARHAAENQELDG